MTRYLMKTIWRYRVRPGPVSTRVLHSTVLLDFNPWDLLPHQERILFSLSGNSINIQFLSSDLVS